MNPQYLQSLKSGSGSVDSLAIPIRDTGGAVLGHLIPIGKWILDRPDLITSIARWRKTFMRMFLAQFVSTEPKTRNYLEALAIGQPDRMLFMIRTLEGRDVGHVGLSNITLVEGELDNLMRGEQGGHARLVYFAEVTVLAWGFHILGLRRIVARVLSYNWMALQMHQDVGFTEAARFSLSKVVDGSDVNHLPVTGDEESNVNYSCLEMALTPQDFEARTAWLAMARNVEQEMLHGRD